MSDPVDRAREVAELMSCAMNLLAALALPDARGTVGAPELHAQAMAHVQKLRQELARGGISGPPGFDAVRATAALDDLNKQLAAWDPAAGAPGEGVVATAKAAFAALGLPVLPFSR